MNAVYIIIGTVIIALILYGIYMLFLSWGIPKEVAKLIIAAIICVMLAIGLGGGK